MALFGTDGIRGLANRDLTAELALDVSVAAAHILVESSSNKDHQPTAIVGQDSRASGEFLEAAVVAGLTSAGINVYRVGVLPTPAIAHLVAEMKCDLGVMISASHNPMPDNGIKLFARGGGKLDDAIEARIEARRRSAIQANTVVTALDHVVGNRDVIGVVAICGGRRQTTCTHNSAHQT